MEAPHCNVCKHDHFPEEKCRVCGHKGKGKIYRLLADGPTPAGLNFRLYDQRTPEKELAGFSALARIIRRRVFLEELGSQAAAEFDDYDAQSRHVLLQVGDAPIGYARWRLDSLQGLGELALVDRLCVLPNYRGRGFSKLAMERILEDVTLFASESGRPIAAFGALVPLNSPLQAKLQQGGYATVGEPFEYRGVPHARLCLPSRQQQQQQQQQQLQQHSQAQQLPPGLPGAAP